MGHIIPQRTNILHHSGKYGICKSDMRFLILLKISQMLIKFVEGHYFDFLSCFYDCIFLLGSDYQALWYIELFHSKKQTFCFADAVFS